MMLKGALIVAGGLLLVVVAAAQTQAPRLQVTVRANAGDGPDARSLDVIGIRLGHSEEQVMSRLISDFSDTISRPGPTTYLHSNGERMRWRFFGGQLDSNAITVQFVPIQDGGGLSYLQIMQPFQGIARPAYNATVQAMVDKYGPPQSFRVDGRYTHISWYRVPDAR